ncbi:MAG: DMT family transporter [Chloroflexi bacterium]|nr:MAG: DMT family transporter [Chloroflexota bacterium]MBL1193351.1 DMT family transporter [Chloroflexota bacterium]NOH10642.1 DMT family transporter [Chloroflexota bacterium]
MRTLPLLASLLVVDSLFFISARLLGDRLDPSVAAFYYMSVASLQLTIYGLVTRKLDFSLLRKNIWFFLSIGLFVGTATNLAYQAAQLVDPGTASMLSQFGVIIALALGLFWLRERLTTAQWLGAALAIAGVFVITYQPSLDLRFGALLILLSNTFYVLHTAITKRYGDEMDFISFFTFRIVFTTLFTFIFALGGGGTFTVPNGQTIILLLIFGTTDVVISRSLYYIALRRLTLSIHTIVLTLTPVLTIVWAWLIFQEVPGPLQFAGGSLVLLGVIVATAWRQRQAVQPAGD